MKNALIALRWVKRIFCGCFLDTRYGVSRHVAIDGAVRSSTGLFGNFRAAVDGSWAESAATFVRIDDGSVSLQEGRSVLVRMQSLVLVADRTSTWDRLQRICEVVGNRTSHFFYLPTNYNYAILKVAGGITCRGPNARTRTIIVAV